MSAIKPVLRGRAIREWTYVLWTSLATAGVFAVWFKIRVLEKRKQEYIDFYNNYDDKEAFEAMKAANLFKGFENPNA